MSIALRSLVFAVLGTSCSERELGAVQAGPGPATAAESDTGDEHIADCLAACVSREPREERDGFCPLTFDRNIESCEAVCDDLHENGFGGEAEVIECIADDPLCFVSLERCVCLQLAEDPDDCWR